MQIIQLLLITWSSLLTIRPLTSSASFIPSWISVQRARPYYFINISLTDDPNTREFIVNDFWYRLLFKDYAALASKVNQRSTYLYQIVGDLIRTTSLLTKPQVLYLQEL